MVGLERETSIIVRNEIKRFGFLFACNKKKIFLKLSRSQFATLEMAEFVEKSTFASDEEIKLIKVKLEQP